MESRSPKKSDKIRINHPFFNSSYRDFILLLSRYLGFDTYKFRQANFGLNEILKDENPFLIAIRNCLKKIMQPGHSAQHILAILESLGAKIPQGYRKNMTQILANQGTTPNLVDIMGETNYECEPPVELKDIDVRKVLKVVDAVYQKMVVATPTKGLGPR